MTAHLYLHSKSKVNVCYGDLTRPLHCEHPKLLSIAVSKTGLISLFVAANHFFFPRFFLLLATSDDYEYDKREIWTNNGYQVLIDLLAEQLRPLFN